MKMLQGSWESLEGTSLIAVGPYPVEGWLGYVVVPF